MLINNNRGYYEPALAASIQGLTQGSDIPSDSSFFTAQALGSQYFRTITGGYEVWTKVANDGLATDWLGEGAIMDTFGTADMTDGGSTTGTFVMTGDVPAKSFGHQAVALNITGWAGDSSCTIQVGDGSDADRYSTGTPSVFSSLVYLSLGAASGTAAHAAAVTSPTITLTSGSDFTSVVSNGSGEVTVLLTYKVVA